MKGLVFREFVDMVDDVYGPDVLDDILEAADLPVSKGAYTTVGTYPVEEMTSLVEALSAQVGAPADQLVRAFGRYLLPRFFAKFPAFFEEVHDAFDFLERVHDHIHVEVRKLYPDAELPSFVTAREDGRMTLDYRSQRRLADLAHGLVEALAEHYGESLEIARTLEEDRGAHVVFVLRRAA